MDETLYRIEQILDLYGSNRTRFASKIGMAQSTMTSIFQRENEKAIQNMAESALRIYADVRPEWLLHGEEPMLKSQLNEQTNKELIEIISRLSETIRNQQETIKSLTEK